MLLCFFTKSNMGILITFFAIAIFYMARIIQNDKYINTYNKLLSIICMMSFVCSFAFPLLLGKDSDLYVKINLLDSGRTHCNAWILESYPITLFGQVLDGRIPFEHLDNAYVFMFVRYGIIYFVAFLLGYINVIYNCCKAQDVMKLAVCTVFIVYGYAEGFIQTPFTNFSIIFIGQFLWETLSKYKEKSIKIEGQARID